jgi:hypothetical protein
MRTRAILVGVGIAISGCVLTALYQASGWKTAVKQALADALVKQVPVPANLGGEFSSAQGRVIYVMGGAGHGLSVRFAEAAGLYKKGIAKTILIKSDSMLMEYNPSLARNLSQDEWAKGMLVGFGVRPEDIETVVVRDGPLGTFQEAKTLSNVVSRRAFGSLVLVSSTITPHESGTFFQSPCVTWMSLSISTLRGRATGATCFLRSSSSLRATESSSS